MHKLLSAITTLVCFSSATFADYTPQMPQGSPPIINSQVQQLIQKSIQKTSEPAPPSATPAITTRPQNLPAALYKAGDGAANNFDNQHTYHSRIKQHLQTQKR